MKRLTQIGLLLALCAAFAPRSEASQITFEATGTVTLIVCKDYDNLPVQVGDTWSMTYTFESTTAGQPDPTQPGYMNYPAVTALTFTAGGLSGTSNTGGITVEDDVYGGAMDEYVVSTGELTANVWANPGYPNVYFWLRDRSCQMFSSTALPTTPPTGWDPDPSSADTGLQLQLGDEDYVWGDVTSIHVVGDTTPPTVHSVAANPSILWPPNNKLVDVTVGARITDDDSGVASAKLIVTDEYGECSPTVPMIYDPTQDCWTATVPLRVARNGNDKDGRTYTLMVRATDKAGNVDQAPLASTTVLVPHDQGNAGGNGKKK